MKKYLIFLILLFLLPNIHFKLLSETNALKLVKVMRINQDGSKYLSTNSGISWTLQKSSFINDKKILLVTKNGQFISINSGTSWTKLECDKADVVWDISLYPNPAKSIITFSLKNVEPGILTAVIYNTLGEKVIESNVLVHIDGNKFSSDISFLPVGVYFVRINKGLTELYRNSFIKN